MKKAPLALESELERWRVRDLQPDWDDVLARAKALPARHKPPAYRPARFAALATLACLALLAIPPIGSAIESLLARHGDLLPWHNGSRFAVHAIVRDAAGNAIASVEVRAHSRLLVVKRRDGLHIRLWIPGKMPRSLATWRWEVTFASKPHRQRLALRFLGRGAHPVLTVTLCSPCKEHDSGMIIGARFADILVRGESTVVITGERSGVATLQAPRGSLAP